MKALRPLGLLLLIGSAALAEPATSIAETWKRLGETQGDACPAGTLVYDYWPEGGMRNFYCRVLTVLPWSTFLRLAGRSPFLSGPHSQGQLDLQHPTDFGHYDPEFVRWMNANLVPAARDPLLRARTQKLYHQLVRPLARTYFAVYTKMRTRPGWVEDRVARYLKAAAQGKATDGFLELSSFMSPTGFSETPSESDWGGYDPNLQRTAVLFWLRRTADGTAPLFYEGLSTLLSTYDRHWLKGAHTGGVDPLQVERHLPKP